MSTTNKYKSVQEYFDAQPIQIRQVLLEIKQCILKVVPTATELINYNIPAYTILEGGKRDYQIMIAGYQSHVGFYPHPTTMEAFETELSDYKRGKGSVQFPINKPLPEDLITRMVAFRLNLILSEIT